ncbi:sialidase family protein [uncultured Chloroflexus sp.]|uniref:sialidase family protein n=1 Tax=uncultured Chloroflexus sp. TaxID=214040 RepID=UPI00260B8461|nr:sialidase family protein [uncultured Chloroflexus sp.]
MVRVSSGKWISSPFCAVVITGIVLTLLAGLIPVRSHAQAGAAFVLETSLPASNTKYPQIAVDANGVYVSAVDGIPDNGIAKLWIKGEEAPSFPAPLNLGPVTAGSAQDWYQTAVATAPTGEVYVLWIDQGSKTIKFRRREPVGAWHPVTFEVMRGHTFATEPALAVRTTDGQIVAAWRDGKNIRFAFSNDRGATWSPVGVITAVEAYKSQTTLAAGPNGEVAVVFTRDTPRPLHVMAALWNGTAFDPPVDINAGSSEVFADASVAFSPDPAPNTRIVIAFRGADDGIYFAEKLVSAFYAPWSATYLIDGKGDGRVSVDYDQLGTLHLAWIRQGAGGNRNANQLFYTARPVGSGFLPVVGSPTVASVFNTWADARVGVRAYMHVAHEKFDGDVPKPHYTLFRAPGVSFGSRPVIENDLPVIGGEGKVSVNVTFPDLSAPHFPDQVRWRWGAPPTDTENDSGGWQAFAPTGPTSVLTVPIPPGLLTDDGCVERVLYTQLRRSVDNLIDQVRSDAVVIDAGVRGNAVVANPFSRMKTSPFTAATLVDLIGEGGASDGHPDHTRVPAVFVELRSLGDCSGLQRFALAPSSATLTSVSNLAMSGNRFANILPYPGTISEGPMPVVLRMRDALGNPMTVERTLTYDVTPPTLNGGTMQVQTIAGGPSIIVNLQFNSLSVTDNLYPGRGFWGVWLANSRSAVANPATDPNLVWIPVEAPGDGTSFSLVWSLASGLPETQVTAGTYYVYARVLDGAGNPSATALPEVTISLDQVTLPQVIIPIVLR